MSACYESLCSDESIHIQEYKRFEMYAVTIKISMAEYHHLISGSSHGLSNTKVYGGERVW